jgi:hypothetical protein
MPRATKARKEEPSDAGSDVAMDEAPTSHQPESRDDMSVDQDENEGGDEEDEVEEEEEEEEVQRVRLVRQNLERQPIWGLRESIVANETATAPWLNTHCCLV